VKPPATAVRQIGVCITLPSFCVSDSDIQNRGIKSTRTSSLSLYGI